MVNPHAQLLSRHGLLCQYVRVEILRSNYFEGKEVHRWRLFPEHQVVSQLTNSHEGLIFWILIDQEINHTRAHEFEILIKHVIPNEAYSIFTVLLQ